jgi:hypothetical protein
MSPVWMRSPPMTTGISTRSRAIESRRDLISARSGVLGAYERTGSLTGVGTRRRAVTLLNALTALERPEAAGEDG